MLEKSMTIGSDVIIYDLEDSISPVPEDKTSARRRLSKFLKDQEQNLKGQHVAVRVNDVASPFFRDDISQIVSQPIVQTLVLPKIHSHFDLDFVSEAVSVSRKSLGQPSLQLVPSIESARAMWNLGDIVQWKSGHDSVSGGTLNALLFAAEDYCADTSIIRTGSRRELLFTRSQIVIAAKAFGLEAIDMVCVDFRNLETLKEECIDARQLGFTGKQAIHPSQVDVIKATFVPSPGEINRAVRILQAMKVAHGSQKGAIALDGHMIDAPMVKQALKTVSIAESAGLLIPSSK